MTITLRPYQQKVIDDLVVALRKGYRKPLIVCATGGGKTAIATKIAEGIKNKGNSLIFMCHRTELVDQTYRTFLKNDIEPDFIAAGRKFNPNSDCHIAMVNTLLRRLQKVDCPNVLIADECFSGDTLIDTADGKKKIKDINVGDYVFSYNEKTKKVELKKVINTIPKEITQRLCVVKVGGKETFCTENHLFFTKKGWTKAKDLCNSDYVMCNTILEKKNEMFLLRKRNRDNEQIPKKLLLSNKALLLFQRMFYRIQEKNILGNDVKDEQKICFRKDEVKQPDEKGGSKRKSFHHTKTNEMETQSSWRKRNWSNCRSTITSVIIRVGYGICCMHRTLSRWIRLSNKLQNRCCKSNTENSHRSRWLISRINKEKNARQQKGEISEWSRVESVEIQEQRNIGKFERLLREGTVYDLTVEDNHNYFACGCLVHNCHHLASKTWKTVADYYNKGITIGLTATPCRLDGKPLSDMFDCMIVGPQTDELIRAGYLVPYKYYAPTNLDTSKVKVVNGEYQAQALAEAIKESSVIGDNIEQYKKLAMGKRNVVFACNIKHSQEIVRRYNEAGIPAAHLDGNTNPGERKQIIKDFESGKIKVLSNVDLFGEGFDLPAIEVVSMLRPTMSLSLCIQQWGRGLRTAPEIGKTECIILDHVNNYQRHGMPDEHREWSLDAGIKHKKRGQSSDIKIKRCPNCFFAHSPALKCPNCGYEYTSDGKTIKEVAGELYLIDSEEYKQAQKREVITVESLEELVKIERERGYKNGWAVHTWERKTGKKLTDTFSGYEEIARCYGYSGGWAWFKWKNRKNRIKSS